MGSLNKKFRNNKPFGESGITAEILKVEGRELENNLHNIINIMWREKILPCSWKQFLMRPIHKKGVKTLCENYRSIALMDVL